jgi:cytochrome c peroxidase
VKGLNDDLDVAAIAGTFTTRHNTPRGDGLRAQAPRAPYFHIGSAKDLDEVVRFYDGRFGIGFTDQERDDLVAFLKALRRRIGAET